MSIPRIIAALVLMVLLLPSSSLCQQDLNPLAFGCTMDKLMVSSYTLVLDYPLEKAVAEIGDRLTRVSDRRLPRYVFRIVDKPTIDAFSLAGGYVYINTGMLDFIDGEEMLASVIAHEISHTNRNHQIELIKAEKRRMDTAQLLSSLLGFASQLGGAYLQVRYGTSIAGRIGGEMVEVLGPEISGSACYAIAIAAVRGYGRRQELEADSDAIAMMARAGYDPGSFAVLLEYLVAARDRLAAQQAPATSSLIQSEPGLETRLREAKLQLARPR